MKTSNKILVITLLALFAFALSIMGYLRANTIEVTPIKPIGDIKTINYDIPFLNTFEAGVGKIYLAKGKPKVEVSCAENIHELLNAGFENGKFYIYKKENVHNDLDVVVHVFTDDLEKIRLSIRAELTTEETFAVDELSIETQNRSALDLDFEGEKLRLDAYNNSKIYVNGTVSSLDVSSANSARVRAKNLKANEVKAFSGNAAKIDIQPIDKLRATAANSSSIRYWGQPKELDREAINSGRIQQMDSE